MSGENMEEIKLGNSLIEGKTKIIYELPEKKGFVLVQSKDRITAGDGLKAHDLEGKAKISNLTNARIFNYLNAVGLKTHYVRQHGETAFISRRCCMIPIEWVTRRIATGSFLRRHSGVPEGFRFAPPKLETFYKDDANHDPQWSIEQLISAKLEIGGVLISTDEIEYMSRTTVCVFEVLEKLWASMDCALIDMKIEFGIDWETKEIVLADVIDSDSWRLWPHGDKRLMKDKQVYRDLQTVTSSALNQVKANFTWIAEKLENILLKPQCLVVILMGSPTDKSHCEKIKASCASFGIPCIVRVTSAHKTTQETLRIVADHEGQGIPTIFVAVAGRSNGLGPVLSGNTAYPVINCPPLSSDWGPQDLWSSMRLPSGLGCSTVIQPEAAGICAAQMIALTDYVVWSKLKIRQLNTWFELNAADQKERIKK